MTASAHRNPEVSVIVPFRNAERHLQALLESLSVQTPDVGMEVILVDNRSQDRSRVIAESFGRRLDLHIVDAPRLANASYARNVGVEAARTAKLLFVDADDEVGQGYVATLTRELDTSEYVTSAVDCVSLNPDWVRAAHGACWQVDDVSVFFGFMIATGPNIGVQRSLFDRIGGWPEAFSGSQDIAFSWRAQLTGAKVRFVRQAVYRYRYRDTLGGLYRQTRNWGLSNVLLFTQFRDAGMPARTLRETWREWTDVGRGFLRSRNRIEQAQWTVRLGYCIGRLQGSIKYRTLYL